MSKEWFEMLKRLPPECIGVAHVPRSPRYVRGERRIRYVLSEGFFLGSQKDPEREDKAVCIAVWSPSPTGRGAGYYSCFRIFLDELGRPTHAALYCHYDGTDHSPILRSPLSAREFAKGHGFQEE